MLSGLEVFSFSLEILRNKTHAWVVLYQQTCRPLHMNYSSHVGRLCIGRLECDDIYALALRRFASTRDVFVTVIEMW